MNWFRFAMAAAGAAAGVAALAAKLAKDEKNRKMDEYLMADPEEETILLPERIRMDADAWQALDDKSLPVRISFAVDGAKTAAAVQELLASGGYSSSLDSQAGIIDVLYTQENPTDVLIEAAGKDGVTYTGYCITE